MYILHILLIILSLVIIVVTMLQSKGTGLSIVPGSNDFGKFERRGPEKVLHTFTIGLISAFIVLAMISYFLA